MAYRVGKIYKLVFDEFPGFEARMRSANVGTLFKISRAAEDDIDEAITAVGKHLISWNAEDDDGPLPADVDGVMRLDQDLLYALIYGWVDAHQGKAQPADIPMETLPGL